MTICNNIRTRIAIGESAERDVLDHLVDCTACSDYGDQNSLIDTHLASITRHTAPPALTAALLTIAADHAVLAGPRRHPWWASLLAFAIGLVAMVSTVLIAAQLVVVFAGPYGFGAYASDIVALPTMFYTWMVAVIPVSATTLATLASVRIQLIAILMVALGWFVYSNNKSRMRIRTRE
jgi:hypothetical protein